MRPGDALNNMTVTLNFRRPEQYDYRSWILWAVTVGKHIFFCWPPRWRRDSVDHKCVCLTVKHELVKIDLRGLLYWEKLPPHLHLYYTGGGCVLLQSKIAFSLLVSHNTFEKTTRFSEVKTLKLSRLRAVQQHLQWLEQSEVFFPADLELMSLHSPPLLIKSLILFINWNNNRNQTPGNVCQGC